jgi:hypothetical protein
MSEISNCRPLFKDAFDVLDTRTTPMKEITRAKELSLQMKSMGYDLTAIRRSREGAAESQEQLACIHDAATLLFLQWQYSRVSQDTTGEFASARLFNQVTKSARKIDTQHEFFDKTHLTTLHSAIEQTQSPYGIAQAMTEAAKERKHERAWPWVMLPTFPKQHYGRILLDVVEVDGTQAFITQPTFNDGEVTLFHTHGQNWGWSLPLGESGSGKNRHINTMWEPNSRDQLFPLKKTSNEKKGKAYYSAGDVAVIPPRTIHGIAGARFEGEGMSLEAIARLSDTEKADLIKKTRFGEQSSLHVYRADAQLHKEFAQGDEKLFETNDMILFDHKSQRVWANSGGAWEQRLLQHGPTGEHCGQCFMEDIPSAQTIAPTVVFDRFLDHNSPGLVLYRADQLATKKHTL